MEKHREKQKGLHIMVFIDQEKAYDRVPRQEVWRCIREKGVSEKCFRIVQVMYEGVRTQVKKQRWVDGQDPGVSTPKISLIPYVQRLQSIHESF